MLGHLRPPMLGEEEEMSAQVLAVETSPVRGAAHGGRLYRENLRGHLLFLSKHRGPKVAERARRLLLGALRIRGAVFRGERGRTYREGAAWLASGDAATLVRR